MTYKPLRVGAEYVWQCAIADCPAWDYILPYDTYQKLRGYSRSDGSELRKYYRTERAAVFALQKAQRRGKDLPKRKPFVGKFVEDVKELFKRLRERRCD